MSMEKLLEENDKFCFNSPSINDNVSMSMEKLLEENDKFCFNSPSINDNVSISLSWSHSPSLSWSSSSEDEDENYDNERYKISNLIESLEMFKARHGNLPVPVDLLDKLMMDLGDLFSE